jgi:hypothetical protein
MLNRFYLIVLTVLGCLSTTYSQGVSETPYAQFGLGDVENQGNVRQQGMAGVGMAQPNRNFGNFINPALTAYNRSHVIFDAAFYAQHTVMNAGGGSKQYLTSGNINYLNLIVPVSVRNWTISVGLSPYSNANTRFRTENAIINDTSVIINNHLYEGGLNQVYMANGVKLPAGFSIGISFAYLFGGINRTISQQPILNNQGSMVTVLKSKEEYKLVEIKPAIAYYKRINEKLNFNLGAAITFSNDIGSARKLENQIGFSRPIRKDDPSAYNLTPTYSDTFLLDTRKISLPQNYKFGISFDNGSNWNLALDYTYYDWTKYRGYDQTNVFDNAAHRIAIGGEFVPDYTALKGYLKRTTYRFGGYYYQSAITLQNNKINEIGGTIGMGLPLGKGGLSMLNLSLLVGQRGTTDAGLVQETFFRFFVGMNINDRWFVRYKLD